MALILTIKAITLGLLLALSFSIFILSIIWTNHQIVYTTTGYSPAVVALLVAGALSFLYNLWLLAGGRRTRVDTAGNVLIVQGLFCAWFFALAVFLTARRYTTHYCPDDANRVASDCVGEYRALLAVLWTTFGFNLIYVGLVAFVARDFGGFSTPDGDLIPQDQYERRANLEKTGH